MFNFKPKLKPTDISEIFSDKKRKIFTPNPPKLDYLSEISYAYLPALITFLFFIGSFIFNASYYMTILLGVSTAAMVYFIYSQTKNYLPPKTEIEDFFSVPTFVVLPSGEIKSSNKNGAELVILSNGYLGNLLVHDGFDKGATYRLLNNKDIHQEENKHFIYKSKLLEDQTILIVRYNNEKKDILSQKQNLNNINITHPDDDLIDIDIVDESFNDLPFGYFEAYQGTSSEQSGDNTEILAMNKTLREWVKKDTELLEHIKKFGSDDSKRSMGIVSFEKKQNHFSSELEKSGFLKVFQFFLDKDNKEEKLRGFIMPVATDASTDKVDKQIVKTPKSISQDSPLEQIGSKIFQNSPVPTVILDKNDTIINCNQSFLNLIDVSELKDLSIRNYFPEGERPKFDVQRENTPIEIIMSNPKERILHLRICLSDDKDLRICYLSDVSTEKSLEEKFNQAQKMQAVGQLAGGVAHDFNNLLTAILGYTELLMNRFSPADVTYVDLLQIRNNANRAGNLVRQLLAFSRRQTLKLEIISLTDILPDISRMLERLIGDRIILTTHYAPSLKPIKADITQLEQVIVNLAVNARDAMEANGGVLTIVTENISAYQASQEGHDIMPAADYVKITVSDTGHGIPDEVKAKIFEPFYTTKEQGKGTGLGLSTVYGIIKQSGGFIFVDSKLNKGTDFRIYFPVTHEQQKITIIEEKSQPKMSIEAPHTKTILLVEDEEAVRSFAVRALELRGFNVLQADCGEEAFLIFKEKKEMINLIITDVMMPGLSGPEWIKEAQKIKDNFTVIFMSGYTQDFFRDSQSFDLPGLNVSFLSKPFSLKIFNEFVEQKL